MLARRGGLLRRCADAPMRQSGGGLRDQRLTWLLEIGVERALFGVSLPAQPPQSLVLPTHALTGR